ncbi:MAG: hypothetical protein ACYDA8_06645, partial [Deferrisomatales bacterium]
VLLLLPWPAAIGYRRLYQGVLIRANLTRRVGLGTAIRLAAMAATALAMAGAGLPGAHVAGGALSAGVLAEAGASRWMVRASLARLPAGGAGALSYGQITRFYYPLALSSVLTLAVHPLLTFFLARGALPLESLAVFPVVRALVFLFSCLGLSYQEVGIALLGDRNEGLVPLRRFARWLGLAASAALAALAFTPLAGFWFGTVSGLTPELARLAVLPAQLLTAVPALTVLLSFLRSLHVQARATGPITWATVVEVGVMFGVLLLGIHGLGAVGVNAAAAALLAGRLCSSAWLLATRRRALPQPAGGGRPEGD